LKKYILITAGIFVLLIAGFFGMRAYTKGASPESTAIYEKSGLQIQVNYSRPSKKGRVIFGTLEPYGKVWRTGANEATQISVNKPVSFGGKPLKAGTYSLFTIPNKEMWTVILNSDLGQWGAFTYDDSKDVLRVQVPVITTNEVIEMFTIDFAEGNNMVNMQLMWDQTKVSVPIGVQ
jgi:hypothetical protein